MSGPNVVVIMPSDDDAATKKKPRKSLYPPGKNRWGMPIDKAPREYEKLRPLVICGPSGVGKGTLIDKLMEDFPRALRLQARSIRHWSPYDPVRVVNAVP